MYNACMLHVIVIHMYTIHFIAVCHVFDYLSLCLLPQKVEKLEEDLSRLTTNNNGGISPPQSHQQSLSTSRVRVCTLA